MLAVINFLLVITSDNFLDSSFSNLKSRLVTIPTKIPESDTIGIPPILYFFILFFASMTKESFVRVTGSIIIPDSALFTNLTSLH